jgi:hypothetical protein
MRFVYWLADEISFLFLIDDIDDRWGEFVVTPALMMGMDNIVLDCISFGDVKDLEELYQQT